MGDENQMEQGPAVPTQAKEEAKRSVTHTRKAAGDLRSAASAMADEYRERGKDVLDDALHRVRSFQDDGACLFPPGGGADGKCLGGVAAKPSPFIAACGPVRQFGGMRHVVP